jgi:hypothetical protein
MSGRCSHSWHSDSTYANLQYLCVSSNIDVCITRRRDTLNAERGMRMCSASTHQRLFCTLSTHISANADTPTRRSAHNFSRVLKCADIEFQSGRVRCDRAQPSSAVGRAPSPAAGPRLGRLEPRRHVGLLERIRGRQCQWRRQVARTPTQCVLGFLH